VKSRVFTGITLIVVGLALYGLQYLDVGFRPLALCLIGGLLVAGYFASKSYPSLVFGCILGGLGIGLFGEPRWFVLHEFTEIGLGIGFALIYVIRLAYERRSHWWPLLPMLLFFLLGFQKFRGFRQFIFSSRGWPILIVILGGLIVLGALGRGKKAKQPD
jgi:hypothetical protein